MESSKNIFPSASHKKRHKSEMETALAWCHAPASHSFHTRRLGSCQGGVTACPSPHAQPVGSIRAAVSSTTVRGAQICWQLRYHQVRGLALRNGGAGSARLGECSVVRYSTAAWWCAVFGGKGSSSMMQGRLACGVWGTHASSVTIHHVFVEERY